MGEKRETKHNYSLTKGNVEGLLDRLLMLKTRSKHFLIEVGMPRKQNLSFNLLFFISSSSPFPAVLTAFNFLFVGPQLGLLYTVGNVSQKVN